jgi:hypothetical protein
MTKLKTLTAIATVFALSSTFAMAQSGAVSPKTRSAMNRMHATQSQHRVPVAQPIVQPAASNGTGINGLGVTTNSGRMYNGN